MCARRQAGRDPQHTSARLHARTSARLCTRMQHTHMHHTHTPPAPARTRHAGESHGKGVGCIVDGVPPRLPISQEEIQLELDRRRPGQSIITTPRKEEDTCEVLSGVADGVSLGSPIAILVRNKDQRSQDYGEMSVAYRPSHADATYDFKYGIRAVAGGGRSSARETIGRVAAGAIAKKLLKVVSNTEVGGAAALGWGCAVYVCASAHSSVSASREGLVWGGVCKHAAVVPLWLSCSRALGQAHACSKRSCAQACACACNWNSADAAPTGCSCVRPAQPLPACVWRDRHT